MIRSSSIVEKSALIGKNIEHQKLQKQLQKCVALELGKSFE